CQGYKLIEKDSQLLHVVKRKELFMSEIFEDKTENGKVRPWRERKIENVRYAEYLAILEFKRAHDVRGCGEVLRFRKIGEHLKLYQTWFWVLLQSCIYSIILTKRSLLYELFQI